MASTTCNIIIAEPAPVILSGLCECIKKFREIRPTIMIVDSKPSLMDAVSTNNVELLIVNPGFGGLMHPEEIRRNSLNENIKIFAVETSKLSKATLSLYDGHINITEDLDEIRKKIAGAFNDGVEQREEKEMLSLREKEIISNVVKGLTNQEIADRLFLSVHTVMTHRRNIARKLQIHSATGLTIYAIVNKIVDLGDIKL